MSLLNRKSICLVFTVVLCSASGAFASESVSAQKPVLGHSDAGQSLAPYWCDDSAYLAGFASEKLNSRALADAGKNARKSQFAKNCLATGGEISETSLTTLVSTHLSWNRVKTTVSPFSQPTEWQEDLSTNYGYCNLEQTVAVLPVCISN